MLSDGDAVVVLHVDDGMVCWYSVNKQSWIFCIFHWQCQFNKADTMPTSACLLNVFMRQWCLYECMHVCICEYSDVWVYVCMYLWVQWCMSACMYVFVRLWCLYECMHVCICEYSDVWVHVCMYLWDCDVYMSVCMYVFVRPWCLYGCMHVCICEYSDVWVHACMYLWDSDVCMSACMYLWVQ